jgi:dipeptidyl aminopeptidase/acylaminoacyl peptidase
MQSLPRLLVTVVIGVLPFLARAALIPVEKFFDHPAIAQVRLSPDGQFVAFRAPMGPRMGIMLMDLQTGTTKSLVRSVDESIDEFFWKGNDHIVYVADVGGNEAYAVQSINVRSGRITRLIESFGLNNYTRQHGQWGGILSAWPANPNKIIIQGSRTESSWYANLHEVSVATGKRNPVGGNTDDKNRFGLLFDADGRIRVQTIDTRDQLAVEARVGDSMRFTRLFALPRDLETGRLTHAEILADAEQTLLFVDFSAHDRGALVGWSLVTGKRTGEIFTPPEGEITRLVLSRDQKSLLGLEYEGDKGRSHWFDAEFANLQSSLEETFPGQVVRIADWSENRKRFVIVVSSDVEAGVVFLLDRARTQPKLMALGSARPQLDAQELTPMTPVHFKARDGLALQGYLTRPKGAEGPQPLVLLPHGGPYGVRDYWGYDPEVQFLANRGYAVLQINYRGSGGFGRKFLEAGRLEWGKKMQDDLTDAVQWAIAQGIADPRRVAIYGASYGGYAAMAGVTFTPELYRCAVNYVGAVDMTYLGRRDQGGNPLVNEMFYEIWVHPDMDELKRRSPVNHVETIRVPTLHAYGENDPRVEFRHWKKLKAELDRHRKPYEVVNQVDEGHGFSAPSARLKFYVRLEKFLQQHLASLP